MNKLFLSSVFSIYTAEFFSSDSLIQRRHIAEYNRPYNSSNNSKTVRRSGRIMATKAKEDTKHSKDKRDAVSRTSSQSSSVPQAPDGGYGWIIVMAAFVCNMITDGTAFSFGVIYDDLLDYFHDSKSKTSWVGSIFMGVPLLASPIASALINNYGCRAVSIAGGLIATLGFALSYFANSIEFLCLSFGLVSGIGLSMVYTPAVVIVAFYFEKRRALATGLSVAGSGIGTLAFAPFVEYLTVRYGWRGTFLILAGVMLNTCVFGALYRPLPLMKLYLSPNYDDDDDDETETPENRTETVAVYDTATCSSHIAKIRELYSDPYSHSLIQFPTYLSEKSSKENKDDEKRRGTVPEVAMVTKTTSNENLRIVHSVSTQDEPEGATSSRCFETQLSLPNGHSNGGRYSNNNVTGESSNYGNVKLRSQTTACDGHHSNKTSATERLHPLYRRDIFYKGSLLWLPQTRNPTRVSSCPDLYMHDNSTDSDSDSECGTVSCRWKHVKRIMKEMLDISIFKQPLYLLFFISNFLLYMWYDIPYFYLPNSASANGLGDDQTSMIIGVIGIGNTIGQIAFGVIADLPQFNNSFVYGFGILLCGVSILFLPLCNTMVSLSLAGGLFGTFIGANYALCSIIIVELLSLEKLTNAYGIVTCGQGVANLVGPPIGGLLSDYTGSYIATYYCSGTFIGLSGVIMLAVALHQWHTAPRRHKPGHASHELTALDSVSPEGV